MVEAVCDDDEEEGGSPRRECKIFLLLGTAYKHIEAVRAPMTMSSTFGL